MNLQRVIKKHLATLGLPVVPDEVLIDYSVHNARICEKLPKRFMMLCRSSIGCLAAVLCGLFLISPAAVAQTNYYVTNGVEYSLVGQLPGDQVHSDVAIGSNGGYVVWQDNATDGSGWGISAQRLDGTLSGTLSSFRVNQQGTNNQENPRVAMLKGGGAVYVWQGGATSYQHIYAAFQSADGTFLNTTDILVNSSLSTYQVNAAVAVLNNSNVVVVYSSYDQAAPDSMQDVYGQILSPSGQKVGGEFLVNQFTNYNQRSASVAPLSNGGFIVAWVSEQERTMAPNYSTPSEPTTASALIKPSVDVYARTFFADGTPVAGEYRVNTDDKSCAGPSVAASSDGNYMVVWAAYDNINYTNSWDVYSRVFSSAGTGGGVSVVNSYLYGDQLFPRVAALGADYLITWTSFAQDGSREGVYAQEMHEDGSFVGSEFRVNTVTLGPQIQPVVASDGVSQYLVVWSTFVGGVSSFDLSAQRYINSSSLLLAMAAPWVDVPFVFTNGTYEAQLNVSWPNLLGLAVANFEVYVDGSSTPAGVTSSNQWTFVTTPSSTHSFKVDYLTTDGRRSPLSPAATGTTWGGLSWGGIPFEWMQQYFGSDMTKWPSPTADSDGDGVNDLNEFLAGTVPTNSASVLKQELVATSQGLFLTWDTQPGLTYQVQTTTNFISWSNFGSARFAAGTNDSVNVGSHPGYYRIVLQR